MLQAEREYPRTLPAFLPSGNADESCITLLFSRGTFRVFIASDRTVSYMTSLSIEAQIFRKPAASQLPIENIRRLYPQYFSHPEAYLGLIGGLLDAGGDLTREGTRDFLVGFGKAFELHISWHVSR